MVIFKVKYSGLAPSFVTAAGYSYDSRERSATFYADSEGAEAKAFYNNVEAIERYGAAPNGSEALPVVWIANKPEGEVLQPAEDVSGVSLQKAGEAQSTSSRGSRQVPGYAGEPTDINFGGSDF